MTIEIDLTNFSEEGVGILAGRGRGKAVRAKLGLDAIDRDPEKTVRVVIPPYVYSVNSSFFLGLFKPSVRLLGKEEFLRKYRFEGPNAAKVAAEGVRKSLLSRSPLDN
jgi:hypothetical protein